ncbi:methyl-accepting chemotaxis protein [Roseinatronobacter sp.]
MSEQITLVDDAQKAADRISHANTAVRNAAENVGSAVRDTLETVGNSATSIRATLDKNQTIAEWVQTLDASMTAITRTLAEMSNRANAIKDIAQQVNMLSINARIEAARSGDAGRGFAVVAQEIDRLSHQTAETTAGITLSIEDLTGSISALQKDSGVNRSGFVGDL